MDDDNLRPTPGDHAGQDRYGETMLYDFAKFMTTLSLLMLGGMLTLSGAARDGDIKPLTLMITSGAIALAGVLSFSTACTLAATRAKGEEPSAQLPRYLTVSMSLMALGIGGFLMMWMDSLS